MFVYWSSIDARVFVPISQSEHAAGVGAFLYCVLSISPPAMHARIESTARAEAAGARHPASGFT